MRKIDRSLYENLILLIESGQTANEMAEIFDVDNETIRKFARRRGLKIQRQDMSMENHQSWKGGTTIDRSGYILRRVAKNGPYGYLIRALGDRGDSHGYAPIHRIVMHDHIGRKLIFGEVVDHIDGNKQNNNRPNLRLFVSNAEHLRVTLKGKVPNWTPEGFARITGRPPKKR